MNSWFAASTGILLAASPIVTKGSRPGPRVGLGKRDEVNEDALFTIWELIRRCKPCIVTMEETNTLLHVFTPLNYPSAATTSYHYCQLHQPGSSSLGGEAMVWPGEHG
jgi:hypothetical protein